MKHLSLFLVLVSSISAFAVQYQATSATLSGGAAVSGNYVQMQGGNMTFNSVSASQAGMYDIRIRYMQDYGDKKEQNLVINGTNVGTIVFPQTATWKDVTVTTRLNSGNNTVAITNNWGWVDIQYIDVILHENTPFNLDKNLVNPNANAAAKKVFAFMQENFQKKVISGVMTGDVLSGNTAVTLNNQTEVNYIRGKSGNKTPALVGFDFMHGTGKEYEDAGGNVSTSWYKWYTDATISLAKELYQRGGIPTYCWHWRDPLKKDRGFYSPTGSGDKTTFNLSNACTNANCTAWNTNSDEYKGIIADIDKVAGYLKELQTAGVVVLWRPVHEASGGWFWWGADKKPAPYKLLYKLLFDRLTTTQGLNNLIWVWNSEGADPDWYPGDNYVDIIGRDFYYWPDAETKVNHASLIGEFEKLKNLFGTKKMIALSENGSVPSPENMIADGAGWSWFMPWYGNFVTQANTASDWNSIMNHSYVITLESMPGWGNYNPSSSSTVSSSSRASSSSARSSSGTAVSSSSRVSSSSARSSSARSSSGTAVSSSSRSSSSSARSSSARSSSSIMAVSSSSIVSSSSARSSSSADTSPITSHSPLATSHSPTYYSLKGEPLGNAKPQKAGVYIAKQEHSVKKIVVRE